MTSPASVWTLAGHDPFGGAGIQADIRVASSYKVPIRTLISTHTAQNDIQVLNAEAYPIAWLRDQWTALASAETPAAIKVGLLYDKASIHFIGEKVGTIPLILDPVFASSSGREFLSRETINLLRECLWAKIHLLTPNRPEAETLVGFPIRSHDDLVRAGIELRKQGLKAVLIKGGHGEGDELIDYFDDGERPFFLEAKRVPGEFRGTGCALSTGVACGLAQGRSLREAVVLAHSYVQEAIRAAAARGDNHLATSQETPKLSPLHFGPKKSYRFAEMQKPIHFYVVAPDAQWIERLAKAGVPTLQLRAKALSGEALREAVLRSQAICNEYGAAFFLNDDWRLGIELKVFGVHLGQEDLDALSPDDLRSIEEAGLRLGLSTHSFEEAARAKALNPSYIALGPVFETSCKSMRFGPQGLPRVGEWVKSLAPIPIVAIGGLKREHAEAVLEQGADGIAVISDITEAEHPESRVNDWLKAWPS